MTEEKFGYAEAMAIAMESMAQEIERETPVYLRGAPKANTQPVVKVKNNNSNNYKNK